VGPEDSNLQPDRYERGYFIGNVDEIWYFHHCNNGCSRSVAANRGEALVGVAGRQAFITRLPGTLHRTGRDLSHPTVKPPAVELAHRMSSPSHQRHLSC